MLQVVFRNAVRKNGAPAARVILEAATLQADHPSERQRMALLQAIMWWIDDEAFSSIEITGPARIHFSSFQTLGPFQNLEIIANFLYAGNTLLAHLRAGKWIVKGNQSENDRVTISPDA